VGGEIMNGIFTRIADIFTPFLYCRLFYDLSVADESVIQRWMICK
jgi:hypothetical protein